MTDNIDFILLHHKLKIKYDKALVEKLKMKKSYYKYWIDIIDFDNLIYTNLYLFNNIKIPKHKKSISTYKNDNVNEIEFIHNKIVFINNIDIKDIFKHFDIIILPEINDFRKDLIIRTMSRIIKLGCVVEYVPIHEYT